VSVKSALTAAPFELDLGPNVVCTGFAVVDYEAIIAELGELSVEGLPAKAVPKRRAEFLAGRFAAGRALAALGHAGLPGRNEDGSPRWPAQVAGSITHGAGRAFCAVARTEHVRSLGIDVERVMGPETKAELRARICGDEEWALLTQSLSLPDHQLLTFAFSAKESLYKCLHPLMGRFMDFAAARVTAVQGSGHGSHFAGELTLSLSVDWSEELLQGRQFRAQVAATSELVQSAVLLPA
jgi:4'-phosphopantetheinyl transferase EntD